MQWFIINFLSTTLTFIQAFAANDPLQVGLKEDDDTPVFKGFKLRISMVARHMYCTICDLLNGWAESLLKDRMLNVAQLDWRVNTRD